jgi:hypothetical protein
MKIVVQTVSVRGQTDSLSYIFRTSHLIPSRQRRGGRVTTPAGTASIRIDLYNHSNSGRVAYDDVQLTAVTPNATIRRKTYALGGQPVAMRASGYPAGETTKNGLFYMQSDHLGSNSIMSYGQGHGANVGKEVPNSRGRYFPYGGWRVTPTAIDPIWSPLTMGFHESMFLAACRKPLTWDADDAERRGFTLILSWLVKQRLSASPQRHLRAIDAFAAWLLPQPIQWIRPLNVEFPATPLRSDLLFKAMDRDGRLLLPHCQLQGRASHKPMSYRKLASIIP